MQTTTTRPARARKPAASPAAQPFSPSAVRLIKKIQAEARSALLTELSAKDSVTVLHGFDADTRRVRVNGHSIYVYDSKGNEVTLSRHYAEPDAWCGKTHMQGYWHPSRWYGNQTKVDANGVEWKCSLGALVCDDFGTLVQVES